MEEEKSLKKLILDNLNGTINKMSLKIGVSRFTLDSIVKDKPQKPNIFTIKKICDYFGVNYQEYI